MKENILHECLRKKDEQSEALRMQLLSINDLVAAEGRYHKNCRQIFLFFFFMKVKRPWEDQLMFHVMRTLMQFANGPRTKQIFTLLEKSIKKW